MTALDGGKFFVLRWNPDKYPKDINEVTLVVYKNVVL